MTAATVLPCGICQGPKIVYRSKALDIAGLAVTVAVCPLCDFARCRNKHPVPDRHVRNCTICGAPVGPLTA